MRSSGERDWFALGLSASVFLHGLVVICLIPSKIPLRDPDLLIRSMTFIHRDEVDPVRADPIHAAPPAIMPEGSLRDYEDGETVTVNVAPQASPESPSAPETSEKLTFADAIKKRPGGQTDHTPRFQEIIRERISKSCERHVGKTAMSGASQKVVVLAITILPSGELESVRVVDSSNLPVFDRASVEAVKLAAPFPRFPKGLELPRLKLRVPIKLVMEGER